MILHSALHLRMSLGSSGQNSKVKLGLIMQEALSPQHLSLGAASRGGPVSPPGRLAGQAAQGCRLAASGPAVLVAQSGPFSLCSAVSLERHTCRLSISRAVGEVGR